MTSFLGGQSVSDEEQRRNDTPARPAVVLAVLAILLVYVYLFTHALDVLGFPAPADLAHRLGLYPRYVFDQDKNIDCVIKVKAPLQYFWTEDIERFYLFAIIAGAFLSVYFLPVERKRPALVAWGILGIAVLYGLNAVAGLIAGHLLVYLVFHGQSVRRVPIAFAAGALARLAYGPKCTTLAGGVFLTTLAGGIGIIAVVLLVPALEKKKERKFLRAMIVQAALLVTAAAVLFRAIDKTGGFVLPLGAYLFLWQYERLMLYQIDHADGRIPENLSLTTYLSLFLSPAVISNWDRGATIGQAYGYLAQSFLARPKDKLVFAGLRLWIVALVYLVFGNFLLYSVNGLLNRVGLTVYSTTKTLIQAEVAGRAPGTATVLLSTLEDFFHWTVLWAAVTHFKVGCWRIFGFDVDPYFNRPWLATNLVTFWTRYTFHYREFLFRVFYYPVFARLGRARPWVRIFAATFAAAGIGNMIWGHVPEAMLYANGYLDLEGLFVNLSTWLYFVLLSLGIFATEVWLLARSRKRRLLARGHKRRRPWTLDRWIVLDGLAMYATVQYYTLIHVFFWAPEIGNFTARVRLFLKGLGLA